MEIYRCTIHLGGSSVTSAWNTEKYWAKQQAMKYVEDNRHIGHISYETLIVNEGSNYIKRNNYGNTKQFQFYLLLHFIYHWSGIYARNAEYCGNGQGERAEE